MVQFRIQRKKNLELSNFNCLTVFYLFENDKLLISKKERPIANALPSSWMFDITIYSHLSSVVGEEYCNIFLL